ncbi:GerMN domain-containing protein [Candidatus Aerophobetes bacterium]|nr:GerMN domain-containing protein [Candidatus Aerophobetes bacterium]
MRKKILVFFGLLVVSFIAGIIFAPFIQEGSYPLKEWVDKAIHPPGISRMVILYFSTPEEEVLTPVERKITLPEGTNSQIKAILQELIKGPQDTSYEPTLPAETKIRAAYVRESTIYVDFFSPLTEKHPGGTSAELISIYSVVNTLLENFPAYSQVQILIDGKPQQTLAGHIDIRGPFAKNSEIVKRPK